MLAGSALTHDVLIDGMPTVDAEELHMRLGVGKDFSTWIKGRNDKYGFSEGSDFIEEKNFPQNGGKIGRGRPKGKYFITLDMAKHLSMVEKTAKGREARQYFIEQEKRDSYVVVAQLSPEFTGNAQAATDILRDMARIARRDFIYDILIKEIYA